MSSIFIPIQQQQQQQQQEQPYYDLENNYSQLLVSNQNLSSQLMNADYTINQLYNKNYYLMEILSDTDRKYRDQIFGLQNQINYYIEELEYYKRSYVQDFDMELSQQHEQHEQHEQYDKLEIVIEQTKTVEILDQAVEEDIKVIDLDLAQVLAQDLEDNQEEYYDVEYHDIMEEGELKNILQDSSWYQMDKFDELIKLFAEHDKLHIIEEEEVPIIETPIIEEDIPIIEVEVQIIEEETSVIEAPNEFYMKKKRSRKSRTNIAPVIAHVIAPVIAHVIAPVIEYNLTNSTIISAKVGNYRLYENALTWVSVHRRVCKNIIEKFSTEYLIANSNFKILHSSTYHVKGFIKSLGVSIQYTDTQSIFEDIKQLLIKTGDTLELVLKLEDGTDYTINL